MIIRTCVSFAISCPKSAVSVKQRKTTDKTYQRQLIFGLIVNRIRRNFRSFPFYSTDNWPFSIIACTVFTHCLPSTSLCSSSEPFASLSNSKCAYIEARAMYIRENSEHANSSIKYKVQAIGEGRKINPSEQDFFYDRINTVFGFYFLKNSI